MKALKYVVALALILAAFQLPAQKGKADKMFGNFDYARAIPHYLKYLKKNPSDQEARENLAYCYRMIKDYPNSESWYAQVCKGRNADPQNRLYFAEALINNGKHEKAIPNLELYLEQRGWDEVANNMLESCRNLPAFYEDSTLHYVTPVNINTPGPEFGPVIYKNTVVFASPSDRDKVVFNWTGDAFLDLWVAPFNGNAKLGDPVPMLGSVNSRYHEGGATFTPDGNEMYFTRNNYFRGKVKKDENRIVRLKAYKAENINGRWSNISEFPFNSDEYSVGHPCMNREGNIIYFVSDMPGGSGGTDIWMSKKRGEDWSKPVNLGDEINSPGDEMFPWISATGIMYYASNGKGGMGGLDLFRVTNLGGEGEAVNNMGYPVNSFQDDFALVVDERTGQGFFTSNRKGGEGDDDLYSLRAKQLIEGIVLDKEDGTPIPKAKVEVFSARGLVAIAFADEEGRFRMGLDRNTTFQATGDAEAYLESQIRISTVSFDPKVPIEALIKLEKDLTCEAPFALDGTIFTKTDSVINEDEDFSDATVRVIPQEFTVEPNDDGKFALSLQPDMDYEIRVEKPGYMDRTTFVSTKGKEPGTLSLEAILTNLSEDTSMYQVFYDYDDSRLRSYAIEELNKVVEYMQRNPEVKIRLVSTADSRGTTFYNDRLSKERTQSAYEYLRMEGIEKDRLELVWIGERRLQNDCGDGVPCPEEEHQKNRRTDVEFAGLLDKPTDAPELVIPPLGEGEEDDASEEEVVEEGEGTEADGEGEMEVVEEGEGMKMGNPDGDAEEEDVDEPKGMRMMAPETEVVEEAPKMESKPEPEATEKVEVTEPEMKKETPEEESEEEVVEDAPKASEEDSELDPEIMEKIEIVEPSIKKEAVEPEVEGTQKEPEIRNTVLMEPGVEKRTETANEAVKEDGTKAVEKVVENAIEKMENAADTTSPTEVTPPQKD